VARSTVYPIYGRVVSLVSLISKLPILVDFLFLLEPYCSEGRETNVYHSIYTEETGEVFNNSLQISREIMTYLYY
jgi:hypothetical protein